MDSGAGRVSKDWKIYYGKRGRTRKEDRGMTSFDYTELARAFLWGKDYPQDMRGLTVRVVDFTSERAFQRLAGDQGISRLTDWRAVQDRIAQAVRRRGGRVRRIRVSPGDYEAWRKRHTFIDNRRVRGLFLANGDLIRRGFSGVRAA